MYVQDLSDVFITSTSTIPFVISLYIYWKKLFRQGETCFSQSAENRSNEGKTFPHVKLLVAMHIRAKMLLTESVGARGWKGKRGPPGNSSYFLILISQHFEFGTAEIARHILRASSDKVNILAAPSRLLAPHTYARTRGRVGDTPRSTSSKNVLKANTCILRRLAHPPSFLPFLPETTAVSLSTPRLTSTVFGRGGGYFCQASSLYVLFPPVDIHLLLSKMYTRARTYGSYLWQLSRRKSIFETAGGPRYDLKILIPPREILRETVTRGSAFHALCLSRGQAFVPRNRTTANVRSASPCASPRKRSILPGRRRCRKSDGRRRTEIRINYVRKRATPSEDTRGERERDEEEEKSSGRFHW